MAIYWSNISQNLDLVINWSKYGGPLKGTSTKEFTKKKTERESSATQVDRTLEGHGQTLLGASRSRPIICHTTQRDLLRLAKALCGRQTARANLLSRAHSQIPGITRRNDPCKIIIWPCDASLPVASITKGESDEEVNCTFIYLNIYVYST